MKTMNMVTRSIGILIGLTMGLHAEPYTLGQGIQVNDAVNMGGYFSTEFLAKKGQDTASVEDMAVMAYGPKFKSEVQFFDLKNHTYF
jgi:hypothetical protein